ncbi:MAG: hypothetical protein Q9M97_00725 [Candidatus Gracilibacteria bacterium]|nr:hypothetical protein [Candidatus Gracilibacteria bacterium]
MKNKLLLILFIIIGIIFINFVNIKSYYYTLKGNTLYENKVFSGAINNFNKSNSYIGLYNIGNSYYRIGENFTINNIDKKIENYELSLKYYTISMKLKYTKNTEFNYNFVKNKLDELKKLKEEEEEKKEEQTKKSPNPLSGTSPRGGR